MQNRNAGSNAHTYIGTYNLFRIYLLRFFKSLYDDIAYSNYKRLVREQTHVTIS